MSDHAELVDRERYSHVWKAVMEEPWAILPNYLAIIRDIVITRASGERLSKDEIQARVAAGRRRSGGATSSGNAGGGVAVISVSGVITPRATLMSELSGGTSVEAFRDAFRQAIADPDVGAIVLDVDSPGGRADLLPELAATMRAGRARKPVVAVSNTLMASAAYWIGSQADELYVSPSGLAGSIGVYATHQDLSAQMEMLGVKPTLISAGRFKTEGNPYGPLTDEAKTHLQGLVDETARMFHTDVSKGRGVPVDTVRGEQYGEGRLFMAREAVDRGMADGVGTFEQAVTRAAELAAGAPPLRGTGTTASVLIPGEPGTDPKPDPDDTALDHETAAAADELVADVDADDAPPPAPLQSEAELPEPAARGGEPDEQEDDARGVSFAGDVAELIARARELRQDGRRLTAAKREHLSELHAELGTMLEADSPEHVLDEDADFEYAMALERAGLYP